MSWEILNVRSLIEAVKKEKERKNRIHMTQDFTVNSPLGNPSISAVVAVFPLAFFPLSVPLILNRSRPDLLLLVRGFQLFCSSHPKGAAGHEWWCGGWGTWGRLAVAGCSGDKLPFYPLLVLSPSTLAFPTSAALLPFPFSPTFTSYIHQPPTLQTHL